MSQPWNSKGWGRCKPRTPCVWKRTVWQSKRRYVLLQNNISQCKLSISNGTIKISTGKPYVQKKNVCHNVCYRWRERLNMRITKWKLERALLLPSSQLQLVKGVGGNVWSLNRVCLAQLLENSALSVRCWWSDSLDFRWGSLLVVYCAHWSLSASSGMFGLLMRTTVWERRNCAAAVCLRMYLP